MHIFAQDFRFVKRNLLAVPRKSKGGRRKNRRGGNSRRSGTSSSSLVYRGPVVRNNDRMNTTVVEIVLAGGGAITSTAGGVIANTFSIDDPGTAANWSDYATVWDEYRVLAAELYYSPQNVFNKLTTTVCAPGYLVIDRDGSSALTSYSQASAYGSSRFLSLEKPFRSIFRMNGVREAIFVTTASPGSTGSWLMYFSGLTASMTYGQVLIKWRVQFRGIL